MVLVILRGLFILLVAVVTAAYLLPSQEGQSLDFVQVATIIGASLCLGGFIIAIDAATPRKRLFALSGAFLGLLVGLVIAFALGQVVELVGVLTAPSVTVEMPSLVDLNSKDDLLKAAAQNQKRHHQGQVEKRESYLNLLRGTKILIGLATCYLAISLVLQTRDDFRFVIPYVEFAKQLRGPRPVLLDTSVVIDGRIVDVVRTRFLTNPLIVPQFVIQELQTMADSADKVKRARARRGLDILHKLQNDPVVGVSIEDREAEGASVDQKLLDLATRLQAQVMTNDFNLAKIALLRKVDVLNLNDLSSALRPAVLPGQQLAVHVLKQGENPNQGVGYLDDGTMVVVENGRQQIGRQVAITVTSMLQTSAGRMIFGRIADAGAAAPAPTASA